METTRDLLRPSRLNDERPAAFRAAAASALRLADALRQPVAARVDAAWRDISLSPQPGEAVAKYELKEFAARTYYLDHRTVTARRGRARRHRRVPARLLRKQQRLAEAAHHGRPPRR